MVAAYFIAILFTASLAYRTLDSPGTQLFTIVYQQYVVGFICWESLYPPLLRAVEYLVMDVWADLLRFGTVSQNPFENEGLD